MCGINLTICSNESNHEKQLFHRGPDQEYKMWIPPFTVTYNRLTITGGKDGQAPVFSNDKRWICFLNGEIYNFRSIKSELRIDDTNSDTKVLVEGFSRFGFSFLEKISGMYAAVLLDTLENRIIVFRDPLGEKPLFFALAENRIEISSEIRPIIERLNGSLELNQSAIADYFRFGYVEEPWSIDKRVKAFERGTAYQIDSSQIIKKLDVSIGIKSNFDGSLRDLIDIVNCETVPSDVGQVVLLSGGIDSASMIKNLDDIQKEKTLALTLDSGGDVNRLEVRSAIKSARRFGIRHSVLKWTISSLIQDLEKVALGFDQPHSDMASLGYFKLFEEIRNVGFKVSVSGHGPDEIFWGYDWFNQLLNSEAKLDSPRIFWNTPADTTRLLSNSFVPEVKSSLAPSDEYLLSKNRFQRCRAEMVHSYLSHNGLRQMDRLAMYFSIEPRTPYADYRIYLWAQSNANTRKDLNKRTFKSNFSRNPFNRLSRRNKQGFDTGIVKLMNAENFHREFVGIFDSIVNRDIPWSEEIRTIGLNSKERYRLLMLEFWLRQYD